MTVVLGNIFALWTTLFYLVYVFEENYLTSLSFILQPPSSQPKKYAFPTKRILLTTDPKDRSIKGMMCDFILASLLDRASGRNFGLNIHLLPYFVYMYMHASSEGDWVSISTKNSVQALLPNFLLLNIKQIP